MILLQKRGIGQAAQDAQWLSQNFNGQVGWAYPVFHYQTGAVIATRWKAAKPNGMKYGWIPSKPSDPAADWYILPGTKEAIAAANGIVNLANGEPALLAYYAAGIYNVIATTLSEISVPSNLLEVLQVLGVSCLLYPADNDEAGRKSAIKWRDALRGSGIDFQALSWGEAAPAKADANDIWIANGFDKQAFTQTLAHLQGLELPAPEPQRRNHEVENIATPQSLIDALVQALKAIGYKQRGEWLNGLSIFRPEKQASAGMNIKSGAYHDFAGGDYSPNQVAEALGINWQAYSPKQENRKKPKRPANMEHRSEQQIADSPSDEKPMATWANDVKLPGFSATAQVNLPYISNLDECYFEHETLLIKSPLATGKTEYFKRLIAHLDTKAGRDISVLVLTHVQALAENLAERFGIDSYRDVPEGSGREFIDKMQRLVCSYDSIHLVAGRHFDLVLIDEHEQFHSHVVGGTMKGFEASRNYCILKDLVATASKVVVADAHMTNFSAKWLVSVRETSVTTIENQYRRAWGKLHSHKDAARVLGLALANAQSNQGPVVIVSNSRTATEVYAQLAIEILGEGVLVVNGWNSAREDIQTFIRNIDQELPKLRLLICSPTFATGIDIQAHVAGVYGIFSQNNWGSAGSILQQIMRFRNAGERRLYVPPVFDGEEETDWKPKYSREMAKLRGTAEAASFEAHNISIEDPAQQSILKLQTQLQAQRAAERNELFSYVIARAKDEGFELQFDESEDPAIRGRLREARAALRDEKREMTMNLAALSPEAFDQLRRAGLVGRQEDCQLSRWKIEYAAGQAITEELYDLLSSGKKRSDFNRVVDLLENMEKLQERDRAQALAGDLISKRGHYTKHQQLTVAALRIVFGIDFWNSKEELTEAQINERLQAWVDKRFKEIETFDTRRGLKPNALSVLRRLMGSLTLAYKRVRDGKNRHYVYFLDAEHTARLKELAQIALGARRLREQEDKCPKIVYAQSSNTILGQDLVRNETDAGDAYAHWLAQTQIPI
jgi:hypothetical protein